MKNKINLLDGNLAIGRKYRITQFNKDGRKSQRGRKFVGELVEKYEHHYLFEKSNGVRECFLKKNFIIGEYGIEEV